MCVGGYEPLKFGIDSRVSLRCASRQLPKGFPPWQTVYWYFTRWHNDGTIERVHDVPRGKVRKAGGRDAPWSAGQ
ncbi:transposase [Streptomyces goshikiensis]|uniref:transposase n=1 Tax=Streptomyces goshikiensis TaxID=1942 RepID=UPI00365923EB